MSMNCRFGCNENNFAVMFGRRSRCNLAFQRRGAPAYTRRLGQSTLLDEVYAVIVWMGGEMLFADALEVPACHDPP